MLIKYKGIIITMNIELFRVREVAEILKVDPQTVYRWVRKGKINIIRLSSGGVRISRSEIDKFITPIDEKTQELS